MKLELSGTNSSVIIPSHCALAKNDAYCSYCVHGTCIVYIYRPTCTCIVYIYRPTCTCIVYIYRPIYRRRIRYSDPLETMHYELVALPYHSGIQVLNVQA